MPSDRLVLVIGYSSDPHVARVLGRVRQMGATAEILEPAYAGVPSSVALSISNNHSVAYLKTGHGRVSLDAVTTVWWRANRYFDYNPGPSDNHIRYEFCRREWRHALDPLEGLLGRAKWVNARDADRKIGYKPAQLLLAKHHGFDIPNTVIGNDLDSIVDLLEEHGGEGIYKSLTWYFEPPDKMLFTTAISRQQIMELAPNVIRAPGIFQQRIRKAFELRITVVGDSVFCFRIDSQEIDGAGLDWRRRHSQVPYSQHQLPSSIQERLLQFHRSAGIVFGAYDFIVTPDDQFVFLEVNTGGAWLWMEDLTGGSAITDAVARALL